MLTWQTIRHLSSLGHSDRKIAQTLGVSRKTVARALSGDQFPTYQRASANTASLETQRQSIEKELRRGLSGVRLLEEARGRGYSGSRTCFYDWLAKLKSSLNDPLGSCRFETGPAEQAQFDWSPYILCIGGALVHVVIFALECCYSRRCHWFPSLSERQDSVLEGMEAGFSHLGGCCRFLLIDNAKSMVLRHRRSQVVWNACFLAFCGHYRIQPIAATPAHPQTKGKVENPFRALESRFLTGREWRDWNHFETELAAFEAQWEQRIHATTKQRPIERFEAERALLLALPKGVFLGARSALRSVNNDGLFSFGNVAYCVPGNRRQVRVRTHQARELLVYDLAGELLIRHTIRPKGSPPVIVNDCYEGHKK